MSLQSNILKIFSLDTEEDFDSKVIREGKRGAMTTLVNLIPLILLVIFIGIAAFIGYQVGCRFWMLLLKQYLLITVSDFLFG